MVSIGYVFVSLVLRVMKFFCLVGILFFGKIVLIGYFGL